jgi:hypothetical protein
MLGWIILNNLSQKNKIYLFIKKYKNKKNKRLVLKLMLILLLMSLRKFQKRPGVDYKIICPKIFCLTQDIIVIKIIQHFQKEYHKIIYKNSLKQREVLLITEPLLQKNLNKKWIRLKTNREKSLLFLLKMQ